MTIETNEVDVMSDKKMLRLISMACAGFAVIMLLGGCVERKLTVNTEPSGAVVWLNDEEIGTSPVTVEFNWYGDYKVHIFKEGYETLNTHKKLARPLHDKFPFDFIAEILWPKQIVDEYEWEFSLTSYQAPQREELIDKAELLKQKAIGKLPKDEPGAEKN
jgi:hypothetical protein